MPTMVWMQHKLREMGAVELDCVGTEHMFFQPEALRAMRQMLLARDDSSEDVLFKRSYLCNVMSLKKFLDRWRDCLSQFDCGPSPS